MLHELLLALSGHGGGLFKDCGEGLKVLEGLPFIHPSEVNVLNQLCRLGTYFRDFSLFIDKYGSALSFTNTGDDSDSVLLHGLYLKALCTGLDRVLQDYRQVLLSLESQVLADPHLGVTHVLYTLQEYKLLFPALASVIDQIVSHKAHGCYILDILHKASSSGFPVVKQNLTRILHVCHGVLFKQLGAWLLHGNMHGRDPYNEFFVQPSSGEVVLSGDTQNDDEDVLGIMGVTGRQLQRLMNLSCLETPSESSCQFCVKADLLPSYIPQRVANKILFIGESIQIFENDKQKVQSHKTDSILKDREWEFAKDLHELSKQPEFNCMAFEALIDQIRTCVSERLWTLVVKESGLVSHLRMVKDFYLLGRGELCVAFIGQAGHLLETHPTATTEHDINMAYQQAARSVHLEEESFIQRFHLTVDTATKPNKKSSQTDKLTIAPVETGWSRLSLSYSVQWPLHIFFTPAVLETYSHIFRFLLAVRRTQIHLQQCWSLQMQNKTSNVKQEEAAIWQLRTHLAFFIDNLQYYLQVDVIESQFGILLDKINSTQDFEVIKVLHEQFLTSLLSQSFVHMKSVSSCLYEIFALCTSFSQLLVSADVTLSTGQLSHIQTITTSFQRQSNLLFRILSSVNSHSSSPHLAQLLLRLDFNKYFTISGGQLGSVYNSLSSVASDQSISSGSSFRP
ncbi:gamma-tubulin complex component 4-like [Gigantopelta aegis]|uniref:gamma-tubulin complex component 4-like n=1 Tax=Gigantopelta aegis TaxID=1735272 RepID=UPI001B88CC31|nr:gamma-tubulin complex component 4-like [Gigantopelta aegis]